MKEYTDRHIITSWQKNAQPWINIIRDGGIESRVLVTNHAIINAIRSREPKSVLDIGCGEGWLVRVLQHVGIHAVGVDVSLDCITYAQNAGPGKFTAISYEEISKDTFHEKFDVVVCNFSLLGDESVSHLFKQVPFILHQHGAFIIQTLHPILACGEEPYEDGWRAGSWDGFSKQFHDPPPWYFRTLDSWKALFQGSGFKISEVLEPIHPHTKKPASIIFIAESIKNLGPP
ncbi:MAG: methyltransferase domain-containing protein [Nitrospirales bacterium]|nr:class I SAM-dependent methyltransferase [Nitrospirales bacterium]